MGIVNGDEHVWNPQQKKSPITRDEELSPALFAANPPAWVKSGEIGTNLDKMQNIQISHW